MKKWENEFQDLIQDLADHPKSLQMKAYLQHGTVTTYEHSLEVARHSYRWAKQLHLRVDEHALVAGAFLHDYYLYDWHEYGDSLHGYHHAARAEENARRDFSLSEKALGIIRTHMWPLNLTQIPSSKEAALVCVVDKAVSLHETIAMRK